jgi:hypothetical protein
MQAVSKMFSGLILTATLAVAQSPAILLPHVYSSGAVGIVPGQTAKWSIVNPPSPAPIVGPTCSVTLSFANEQGEVLKNASVTVKPGESRSLDLKHSDFPSIGNRAQVHALAVIPVTGPVDQPTPQGTCTLVPTLEIVDDATGKTSAVTEGTLVQPIFRILPAANQTTRQ